MSKSPRIILWDLETLPNLKQVLRVFPQLSDYPGQTLKASINSIICFGWKVLGERRVNCTNAWDFKEWRRDVNNDRRIVEHAHKVLSEADAIVTHNGKRFDWKFLQSRLGFHGLSPLPKIIHIDTCQEAKKNFYFFNNRLNTIAHVLTDSQKKENGGWPLWVKVHERDPKAMKLMEQYCKQDVRVLEDVFNEMRPWIKGLPELTEGAIACPSCGSHKIQKRGRYVKKMQSLQRYQCQSCGSWSQEHGMGVKEL